MDGKVVLLAVGLALLVACNDKRGTEAYKGSQDMSLSGSEISTLSANALSRQEKAEGWQLLFDGHSTDGWHTYQMDQVTGWQVDDGVLFTPGGQGDLITDKVYEDFELTIEWKIQAQGNSGIFYYVVEKPEYAHAYETGPEFQIIDDENYPQVLKDSQKTGALSNVMAPTMLAAKKPGEWNHTRIKVSNGHVEHWLNNQKVLEYRFNSKGWISRVAESKFASSDYSKVLKGHIGLQDHGGPVAFRNIKIREL